MSCRALSQPLFLEALASGYGNGDWFLDRIEKAFDWPPLKALPAPIHASRHGAGLSALRLNSASGLPKNPKKPQLQEALSNNCLR